MGRKLTIIYSLTIAAAAAFHGWLAYDPDGLDDAADRAGYKLTGNEDYLARFEAEKKKPPTTVEEYNDKMVNDPEFREMMYNWDHLGGPLAYELPADPRNEMYAHDDSFPVPAPVVEAIAGPEDPEQPENPVQDENSQAPLPPVAAVDLN